MPGDYEYKDGMPAYVYNAWNESQMRALRNAYKNGDKGVMAGRYGEAHQSSCKSLASSGYLRQSETYTGLWYITDKGREWYEGYLFYHPEHGAPFCFSCYNYFDEIEPHKGQILMARKAQTAHQADEQAFDFTIKRVLRDAVALFDREGNELDRKFFFPDNLDALPYTVNALLQQVPQGASVDDQTSEWE